MATRTIKKTSPTQKSPAIGSSAHYQAQEDMHTLKKAEQVRQDPSRHKAAVMHAKSEVASLQKVARKKV